MEVVKYNLKEVVKVTLLIGVVYCLFYVVSSVWITHEQGVCYSRQLQQESLQQRLTTSSNNSYLDTAHRICQD